MTSPRLDFSVVRDYGGSATVFNAGATLGYALSQRLSLDVRGTYAFSVGSGNATHYFRGSSATIGSESANFDYESFTTDVGVRVFPFDVHWCLRPYFGLVTYAHYKFEFGTDNASSLSQDESMRPVYGGVVSYFFGVSGLEVGLDYSVFNSGLGGSTSQGVLFIGLEVNVGKK